MGGEADQTLAATDTPAVDEGKNDSGVESDTPATSSSVILVVIKMANNRVLEMSDYWKKSIITKADR
jgi:hypothetical protein